MKKHLFFVLFTLCLSACAAQKQAKHSNIVLSLKNVNISAFNPYLVKNDTLQFRLLNTKYYVDCIEKKYPNCDTVYLTQNDIVRYIERPVLQDISTEFERGKIYYLVGESGSGKSTLAMGIAGIEPYRLTAGEILLNGKNISKLSFDERLKHGIYIAMQDYCFLPEDKSISVYDMLKRRYNLVYKKKITDKKLNVIIDSLLIKLELPKEILQQNLNSFYLKTTNYNSEENILQVRLNKRLDVLQMLLLKPQIIIFDEFDSFKLLDFTASVKSVGQKKIIEDFGNIFFIKLSQKGTVFLIITHIYDWELILLPDKYICLEKGKIIYQGNENVLQNIKNR
jgi:Fe-S cluster assembly ATP-binding protein